MNKTSNFILIAISNVLFCFILILISSFLILKFDFEQYSFITYLCLLLTGVFSGKAKYQEKKLINSFISSTILFFIYLAISFVLKHEIVFINSYLIVAFNIYLGTLIGCILSVNQKTHTKGRLKR